MSSNHLKVRAYRACARSETVLPAKLNNSSSKAPMTDVHRVPKPSFYAAIFDRVSVAMNPVHKSYSVVLSFCPTCIKYWQSYELQQERVGLSYWNYRCQQRLGGPIAPETIDPRVIFGPAIYRVDARTRRYEVIALGKALGLDQTLGSVTTRIE